MCIPSEISVLQDTPGRKEVTHSGLTNLGHAPLLLESHNVIGHMEEIKRAHLKENTLDHATLFIAIPINSLQSIIWKTLY